MERTAVTVRRGEPAGVVRAVAGADDPRWPAALGAAAGFGTSMLLAACFVMAGDRVTLPAALVVMALAAGGISWASRPWGALTTGICAWLMLDGFVVNRAGELGWDGWTDGVRLAVLVGVSVIACASRFALLAFGAWRRADRRVVDTYGSWLGLGSTDSRMAQGGRHA